MLNLEKDFQNSQVQFKYLVSLALKKEVSWTMLKGFLYELTSTFEKSKKLNTVLLEELQLLHCKASEKQTQEIHQTLIEEQEITNKVNAQGKEIVENAPEDDDEVMVLFTKQETIEEEPSFVEDDTTKVNFQSFYDFVTKDTPLVETLHYEESQLDQLNEDKTSVFAFTEEFETNASEQTYNLVDETTLSENEEEDRSNQENPHLVPESLEEGSNNGSLYKEVFKPNSNISKVMKKRKRIQRKNVFINGERKYSCETCGQLFNRTHNLKCHETMHSGEKQFECKFCSKRFSRLQDLTKHERVHTGEKPYQCKSCSKIFSQISSLKRHEIIHTEVKPFSCKYCTKQFNLMQSLTIHERFHTQQNLFECDLCSKKFKVKSELKQHLRSHSKEKTLKCQHCPKLFKYSSSLRQHKIAHHSQHLKN